MIELLKVTIQDNSGQKMVGVRYKKDGQTQPFIIFHFSDLDSLTGNVELKEAVKAAESSGLLSLLQQPPLPGFPPFPPLF